MSSASVIAFIMSDQRSPYQSYFTGSPLPYFNLLNSEFLFIFFFSFGEDIIIRTCLVVHCIREMAVKKDELSLIPWDSHSGKRKKIN